ncbi:MAG: hypothetical protein IPN99_01395 [Bacteroidetes bacterium]|nr:hypothetical protein [Bacteroidota bacterium]
MNNFSKIAVFIWLLAVLVFAACKKHSSYPVEPEISFKSFEKFGKDSARLIISFTDGDGDIGLGQGDTAEPYLFNFYTRYYQKINGVFTEKTLSPPFNYRIPILYSGKKPKSLEGDILITYLAPIYFPTSSSDTIQYEVYIKDRALNTSNSVRTGEIIFP